MHFILSLVLFVTTGCATPDLVAVDAPAAEPQPVATPARQPSPDPLLPQLPEPAPAPKTCAPRPLMGTCAGAIGFCPEWRCIDGEWVDVRPNKNEKWRTVDP